MARHPKEPAIPSPLVPPLLRYLRARGGPVEALLTQHALPDDTESRDEVSIPPSNLGRLLDAAARVLGDDTLGLTLPAALPVRRYGLGELAARASATLRDALEQVARFAPLENAPNQFRLETREGLACVTHRLVGYPRGVSRHLDTYTLASTLAQARELTGLRLVPERVWFIHPRPRALDALESFFGTGELEFGAAENGLAFAPAVLDTPLRTHDARLLATAEHLASRELRDRPPPSDFTGQVAARIRSELAEGSPTARSVARALHLSSRTLQRRLEDEGTQFSEVLDRVRAELAREYLADAALPLAEVAYRLGFSDVGTFSRAFKRWTGSAPGAFRRGT